MNARTETKSPNTVAWAGRIPILDEETGKPTNEEDVVVALTNIRPEMSPLKVGDRIARLSREQAIRFARDILAAVAELNAADVAKADGAARAS